MENVLKVVLAMILMCLIVMMVCVGNYVTNFDEREKEMAKTHYKKTVVNTYKPYKYGDSTQVWVPKVRVEKQIDSFVVTGDSVRYYFSNK